MGPAVILIAIVLITCLLLVCSLFALWILRRFGLFRARLFTIAVWLAPFALGAVWVAGLLFVYIAPGFQSKEHTFKSIFQKTPGAEFHVLNARASGGTDFGEAYILFEYKNAESVTALINDLGLRSKEKPIDPIAYGSGHPEWFRPMDCENRKIFFAYDVQRWDDVSVIECETTSSVYALARWVD